ncbi:hypothetical protein PU629_07975 [Pullulanibacillus sp. KACC 23026]|uniref:hypothetical protein n=1 Tax=Pullulanibacillus sp. KACC 23026 TaxID=3028315 RepID=UPI0023AF97FE|nr:hypothetical protein [Pullulanibacillus sp. KACC 23026]WEG14285.1 hypothetical protein PU629_07975 [Pullulanibacillus sp. KACC 23026]
MALHLRTRSANNDGFILPLTLVSLLLIAMFCFYELDRYRIAQSDYAYMRAVNRNFLAFQSAKDDLCDKINQTDDVEGSGDLTEGEKVVSYTIQTVSSSQYEVHLSQMNDFNSVIKAWFIYNKETKKLEKWVTQ